MFDIQDQIYVHDNLCAEYPVYQLLPNFFILDMHVWN